MQEDGIKEDFSDSCLALQYVWLSESPTKDLPISPLLLRSIQIWSRQ